MWSTLARYIIFTIGVLATLLPLSGPNLYIRTIRSPAILTFLSASGVESLCRIILYNSASSSDSAKELEWRCLPVGASVGVIVGSIQLSSFLSHDRTDDMHENGSRGRFGEGAGAGAGGYLVKQV